MFAGPTNLLWTFVMKIGGPAFLTSRRVPPADEEKQTKSSGEKGDVHVLCSGF
jgi:hypothetical protein